MLAPGRAQRGVTLIEVVIGLALTAMLMSMGVTSFTSWVQNAKIRTAAESIQNGLQLARVEAVRRNTQVGFYLTDTADNGCVVSPSGVNWVVWDTNVAATPAGACGTGAGIIQASGSGEIPTGTVASQEVTAAGAVVGASLYVGAMVFNGLGQIASAPSNITAGNGARIDFSNPAIGQCAAVANPGQGLRCLRVTVSSSGQVRMCDPLLSDPQGC